MQFDSAVDYNAIVTMLKESIKKSPLELKMVWLCELILVVSYMELRATASNNKYRSESVTVSYESATGCVSKHNQLLTSAYVKLCAYRHEFVHHGHLEAMHMLVSICNNMRSELLLLANEYGVVLTFDNTIFIKHKTN